jgi:hypothetical protein
MLVKVVSIPNTTLFLTSYNVSYEVKSQDNDNDNEQFVLLDNVKSEKLRILVGRDDIDNEIDTSNKLGLVETAPLPPVEEATGLGGWQTVSVKEYDEEKERKKVIKQEIYIKKQLIKEEEVFIL